VANTFSYVGIFLGGAIGGYLYQHYHAKGVTIFVLLISLLWLYWIATMRNPGLRANLFLEFDTHDKDKLQGLKTLEGITDFYVNETEKLIVIKYDAQIIDEDKIKAFLHKEGAQK